MKFYVKAAVSCLAVLSVFCAAQAFSVSAVTAYDYEGPDFGDDEYDPELDPESDPELDPELDPENEQKPHSQLRGDYDGNSVIDNIDAQNTLIYYAEVLAGNDPLIGYDQRQAADVNRDGILDATDAQAILQYYTVNVLSEGHMTWHHILHPEAPENVVFDDYDQGNVRITTEPSERKDWKLGQRTFWLDISKRADYVFDGELLELEWEISKDAKAGVYPLEIALADLSNYSGNTDENGKKLQSIKLIPGYVLIGSKQPEIPALGKDPALTAETVTAKPGETVKMHIRIDNNPGITAFFLEYRINSNAITLKKCSAGSELVKAAKLTAATDTSA